jgi:hypothetical protein
MRLHWGLAVLLIGLGATNAQAQSLKDKEYFAKQEEALAKEVAQTNKKCDSNVTAKFDWTTPPAPEDRSKFSAYGYCGAALAGMRKVCESGAMGKDAVKEKIKTVTCGFAPKREIALKDGAIDYKIEFKSSNDADYVSDYLKNNL